MKHRLFAAVDLPLEVASEIEQLQGKLEKLKLPVSWEKAARMHITLVFLGRLPDAEMGRARGIIANTCRDFGPHYLRPVALQTRYQRHEPSAIYLLVSDSEGELGAIQRELARKIDEITPQPRQKFLPHITIGRVKKSDPTLIKQTLDKLSEVDIEPLSEFEVAKISLYESHLSKAGSSYQRLGSFNLGNKRYVTIPPKLK